MALLNMIRVNKVSKSHLQENGQPLLQVLSKIDFDIQSGEFCCILGPSGCGKTTLLNIISGLDKDFDGSVLIDGKTPELAPPSGYMFQSSRLMPWLTARENVALVQVDSHSDVKVNELLNEIGLKEFADAYPAQLSGGMRRRVALARAIITEPSLLLLDEPFLSLDTPVANHLRSLLMEVCARRSATVLFVTHDIREALFLADRVLFLSSRPGQVVLDHRVDIPRPRVAEGEAVELSRLELLKTNPQLLSGQVLYEDPSVL